MLFDLIQGCQNSPSNAFKDSLNHIWMSNNNVASCRLIIYQFGCGSYLTFFSKSLMKGFYVKRKSRRTRGACCFLRCGAAANSAVEDALHQSCDTKIVMGA